MNNVPVGGALGRLESRQTSDRRILYKPKHDTVRIGRGTSQKINFFTKNQGVDRITNLNQNNQVNVHEQMTIFRIIIQPWFGTSEADLIALTRDAMLEMKIQNKTAYQLQLANMASGIGFFNSSVPSQGIPSPQDASDLGEIVVGPGETFGAELDFFRNLSTANDVVCTATLEAVFDEPAG